LKSKGFDQRKNGREKRNKILFMNEKAIKISLCKEIFESIKA
jgi:hypothetical protein